MMIVYFVLGAIGFFFLGLAIYNAYCFISFALEIFKIIAPVRKK